MEPGFLSASIDARMGSDGRVVAWATPTSSHRLESSPTNTGMNVPTITGMIVPTITGMNVCTDKYRYECPDKYQYECTDKCRYECTDNYRYECQCTDKYVVTSPGILPTWLVPTNTSMYRQILSFTASYYASVCRMMGGFQMVHGCAAVRGPGQRDHRRFRVVVGN